MHYFWNFTLGKEGYYSACNKI